MSGINLSELVRGVSGGLRAVADSLHPEPMQVIVQSVREFDPEKALMSEQRAIARENELLAIKKQLIPEHLRTVGALSAQLEMFGGLQAMGQVPEVALIVQGLRLHEGVLLTFGVQGDVVQGIEDATAEIVREFQAVLALHVIDALGGPEQVSQDIVTQGLRAPGLAQRGLHTIVNQEISRIAARSATR